jgi:hypothetical protein
MWSLPGLFVLTVGQVLTDWALQAGVLALLGEGLSQGDARWVVLGIGGPLAIYGPCLAMAFGLLLRGRRHWSGFSALWDPSPNSLARWAWLSGSAYLAVHLMRPTFEGSLPLIEVGAFISVALALTFKVLAVSTLWTRKSGSASLPQERLPWTFGSTLTLALGLYLVWQPANTLGTLMATLHISDWWYRRETSWYGWLLASFVSVAMPLAMSTLAARYLLRHDCLSNGKIAWHVRWAIRLLVVAALLVPVWIVLGAIPYGGRSRLDELRLLVDVAMLLSLPLLLAILLRGRPREPKVLTAEHDAVRG